VTQFEREMVKRTLTAAVPAVLALAMLAMSPAAADCVAGPLTGQVTFVRDGDTIELGTTAIRLNGLAAPEWDARGGFEATAAMRELVLGKVVMCELDGEATYDRCAAICRLDGTDISEEMVRMGLARDGPRYSGGRYRAVEQQAAEGGATIRTSYPLPGYCMPSRRSY
jgi:micrococcal nuclease